MNLKILLLVGFAIVNLGSATLSKSDKKTKTKKKKAEKPEKVWETLTGPQDVSVHSRKLVNKIIQAPEEIVANHAAYSAATGERNFDYMDVLGYVTPWNNHGYDVAKIYGLKFTLISPVWLQVVPEGSSDYSIKGTHDVDKVGSFYLPVLDIHEINHY